MKNIKDYGMCQILYLSPNGNFDYYLSEHGYVIYKAKEGSGCNDGVFGNAHHFRKTFAEQANSNGGRFTADGFRVISGKEVEVLQILI